MKIETKDANSKTLIHIANFKNLENAKAFVEYIEKSGSILIDALIRAQELETIK